jgi:feruloyl-CoA synthase
VGVLLWLNPAGCAATLGATGTTQELAADERVLAWIAERLAALGDRGSAATVARFGLLVEPPNVDAGEVSDKGSINQSITLRRRAADVAALYATGRRVRPHATVV